MGDERSKICMLGGGLVSYDPGRRARWIHFDEESTTDELNLKIFSAFEGVKSYPFKRVIFQFWRPLADGGRRVLESSRNAYALSPLDGLLKDKYRSRCIKYQYSIINEGDQNPNPNPNPNPAWIISGGPVPTAFLNRYPEVVPDLRVHQGSPLVVCALQCQLTSCLMLPLFHAASSESECLGVVECSMKHPSLLLPIFDELKRELERVGLTIYQLHGTWPYKTVSGDLEAARIEIERALEIASESHALTLAQAWIPYQSNNTSQMFLVKMGRYSIDSDHSPIKDFYEEFDVISGEGLASKTLQTHQPHLCSNICNLSDNSGVLALLSARCASFVICLRSSHTGDLDYAFEFFWPPYRNHFLMLETLLLTLSKCMPSFRSASGEQLGNELFVFDVENSSSSTTVKVLPGNRLSVGVKRKSIAGQSSNQNPLTNPEAEDDDLAIYAAYRNQSLLFYLPSSSTSESVLEKLKNEFELDPAETYKVEYEVVPGQWSSLACLDGCKGTDLVKLRVLDNRKKVAWRWVTNT